MTPTIMQQLRDAHDAGWRHGFAVGSALACLVLLIMVLVVIAVLSPQCNPPQEPRR